MIRIAKSIFVKGMIVLGLTALAIIGFSQLYSPPAAPKADVIVVLGAGMSEDGKLDSAAVGRVEKGVVLFKDGAAPQMHFTGGPMDPNGPSSGQTMAMLAQELGVPSDAISTENGSYSTLQNALYSKPMLVDSTSFIIVTDAFHLPRSAASFWWMGYENMLLVPSSRAWKTKFTHTAFELFGRETLAVWFNLARATAWTITGRQYHGMLH